MTMLIDTHTLRRERKKRAWTQERLAEVSDLGLRTIQRIEKTGSASPESVQALAACFDLKVADLLADAANSPPPTRGGMKFRPAMLMAGVAVLALLALSLPHFSVAGDIQLSVNAVVTASDDRYEHVGQMTIAEGKESQFQMNGVFKVLVAPRDLGNNQVMLSLKVFTVENGAFALVSEPSLITASGKEAVFSLGLDDERGTRIRVALTPAL